MFKETQAQKIDRYIRENRTVSGGDAVPPGKPGYRVLTISDDDEQASQQLTGYRDQGLEVIAFSGNRVILENYKGKG